MNAILLVLSLAVFAGCQADPLETRYLIATLPGATDSTTYAAALESLRSAIRRTFATSTEPAFTSVADVTLLEASQNIWAVEATFTSPTGKRSTPAEMNAIAKKLGATILDETTGWTVGALVFLTPREYKASAFTTEIPTGQTTQAKYPFVTEFNRRELISENAEETLLVKVNMNAVARSAGQLALVVVDKSWGYSQFYESGTGMHTISFSFIAYSVNTLTSANVDGLFKTVSTYDVVATGLILISLDFVQDSTDPDLFCRSYISAVIQLRPSYTASLEYSAQQVSDALFHAFKYDSNMLIGGVVKGSAKVGTVPGTMVADFEVVCKIFHKQGESAQSPWDTRAAMFLGYPTDVIAVSWKSPAQTSPLYHPY